MTESKKPYYRNAYQRGYFGTIAASVSFEVKEAFREACASEGTTMHAVLKSAAEEYIKMHAGRPA